MSSMLLHLVLGAVLATGNPEITRIDTPAVDSQKTAAVKTVVEVDNSAFNDAVVYALQGLRSVRLGTVTGLTKQKLTIPRDLVGGIPLRFAIHPIGGRRNSVSDEVVVYEGDTVGLYISPF